MLQVRKKEDSGCGAAVLGNAESRAVHHGAFGDRSEYTVCLPGRCSESWQNEWCILAQEQVGMGFGMWSSVLKQVPLRCPVSLWGVAFCLTDVGIVCFLA